MELEHIVDCIPQDRNPEFRELASLMGSKYAHSLLQWLYYLYVNIPEEIVQNNNSSWRLCLEDMET